MIQVAYYNMLNTKVGALVTAFTVVNNDGHKPCEVTNELLISI